MSKHQPVEVDVFTAEEVGLLKSLVRMDLRKSERRIEGGARRFGDDYDPARNLARLAFVEGLYRKLGGDPDNVTLADERPGP